MFEKYFVTCPVAVALKHAGFDEPCMAARERDGAEDILHIAYDSKPPNPAIYSEAIQKLMVDRPGMFIDIRRNSEMQPCQFAAPLYDQVFEWLFSKGLYLHPYYAPQSDGKAATEPKYGVNVFDKNLKLLWPNNDIFYGEVILYTERRDAIEQAILAAIKLLPDEHKTNV